MRPLPRTHAPTRARAIGLSFVLGFALLCGAALGARADERSGASFYGPEWLDPRDSLHEEIRRLAIRGDLAMFFWTSRGSTRLELARHLSERANASASSSRLTREFAGELKSIGAATSDEEVRPLADWNLDPGFLRLRPYVQARGEWREGRSTRWNDGPRIGLAGSAYLAPRWTIHEDIFAGRVPGGRRFADALIAHTDLLLSMESFYLGYEGTVLSARLGRFRHQFGPGRRGGLLFSAEAPPLDQVEYTLRWPKLRFQALAGPLTVAPESNLAFHRLEWSPSKRVLLALSEGAVYPGSPYQPLYLAGLVPYTLVERLHGQDATASDGVPRVRNNVLFQLDAVTRPRLDSVAYASLLLDDVATESRGMPTRLGYELGWESTWNTARGEWSVGVEGLKIYRYTYSVYSGDDCECDWSHQGTALGSTEGPDVERIELFGSWSPNRDWELELALRHRAHGSGRLGVPWYPAGVPGSENNSLGSAGRLSGTVERRDGLAAQLRAIPSAAATAELRLSIDRVENEGNEKLDPRRVLSASLSVSAHR